LQRENKLSNGGLFFLHHLSNVSALLGETRTFQYKRATLLSDTVVMAKIKFVTSKNNGNGAQCVHLKITGNSG